MRLAEFLLASSLLTGGCIHGDSVAVQAEVESPWSSPGEPSEGVDSKCVTLSARISVLMAKGQFAEAEALIAEGLASGLLSKPQATRLLERIAQLNMRLGQVHASLQRAPDFPSQLKDHTLFQIKQMLDKKDFGLATEAQLRLAKKLIENSDRLMQKGK